MNRKVLLIVVCVLAFVALLAALSSKNGVQTGSAQRGDEPTIIYDMPKTNGLKGK
jgi:hypothetical protein